MPVGWLNILLKVNVQIYSKAGRVIILYRYFLIIVQSITEQNIELKIMDNVLMSLWQYTT